MSADNKEVIINASDLPVVDIKGSYILVFAYGQNLHFINNEIILELTKNSELLPMSNEEFDRKIEKLVKRDGSTPLTDNWDLGKHRIQFIDWTNGIDD